MSRLTRGIAGALLALLILGGCGGGGSSSQQPVATPSPPTGVPPSPPTASPTYETASDFTRDRAFSAIGTTLTLTYAPNGVSLLASAAALDDERASIGFTYQATTRTYRAYYDGDALNAETSSVGLRFVTSDEYAPKANSPAIADYFARTPFRTGLTYAGLVLWRLGQANPEAPGATLRTHRMLFGVRTLPSDLPSSGVTAYQADAELSEAELGTVDLGSINTIRSVSAQLAVDWSRRKLSGTVRMFPPSDSHITLENPVDYIVNGTVAPDGHLTGSITGAGLSGSLLGNVYGPAGAEIGFLLTYGGDRAGQHVDYVGAVLGAK